MLFLAHKEHAHAYQEGVRQGSNLAQVFEQYISRVIGGADGVLLTLRELYEHDPNGFDIARRISRAQLQNNVIMQFSVVGPDGLVKLSSIRTIDTKADVGDRDFFRFHANTSADDLYVSAPVIGRLSDKLIFHVTRRLTAPDGSFGGVILASIDILQLQRFYASIDVGGGGIISLIGFDGIIRARSGHAPEAQDFVGQSVGQAKVALLYRQSPAGSYWNFENATRQFEAVRRLISYQVVEGFPLIAIVGQSEGDIFAPSTATAHKYYLIAVVLTVIVLVATGIGAMRQKRLAATVTALERSNASLEQTNLRFNTSLENMSHGLVMFDASGRLVICNDRYRAMYDLPPGVALPGSAVVDVLKFRKARGTFSGDPEAFVRDLLAAIATGQATSLEVETGDGRTILIRNQPMSGGGWVATHEDVTETKRQEASFRLLFDSNPVPMWVFDRESLQFLAVNDAAVAHYGYSHERFLAMTVLDLRPPEERAKFEQFLKTLPDVQRDVDVGQHRKADGTAISASVFSQTLFYAGHRARLVAVYDVTQRRITENELRNTRRFLDTIIEHVPLPISVKDVPGSGADASDSRFTLVNRAFEDFLGESRRDVIGKTAHDIYPKDRADLIVASDNETLWAGQAVLVREHMLATATDKRVVTARKVTVRDDNGKPQYLLTVLEDVTERRQAERRIAHMAHYDSLTDLPNRVAFNEFLSEALDRAASSDEPLAVLSLDLDRFKEVNDVFGHAVGDALLGKIARRLQAAAGGAFLARLGGDEFSLVVAGPQPATASALAERLLATAADDFEIEGLRLRIGLSIGAALYPVDSTDADTLLSNADAALYRAKSEARGTMRLFEPEMDMRRRDRLALQNDLRSAIDRGELFLHYQPQLRMSGETVGFEALARWQCPKRGLVSPAAFIPVAEDSSLIISIGEWVLREACREAASWPEKLRIAVNVSPIQFRYGDLPRVVHAILLETGLAPDRLELEITESVMISDFSHAISILRRFKALGVRVAMDDFGTGYSSLSFLQSFPCDRIKIDRAFICDLEDNRHSMAIVRAVIGLGRSLNMPVLAEGVETKAQHALLRQEGCDEVQGYLTGRPLPIADYAEQVGRPVSPDRAMAG